MLRQGCWWCLRSLATCLLPNTECGRCRIRVAAVRGACWSESNPNMSQPSTGVGIWRWASASGFSICSVQVGVAVVHHRKAQAARLEPAPLWRLQAGRQTTDRQTITHSRNLPRPRANTDARALTYTFSHKQWSRKVKHPAALHRRFVCGGPTCDHWSGLQSKVD
jgi:hypothetical protein